MQPDEIIFRSLSEVIQKTGKRQFYARGSKVKNLINFIKSDENFVKNTFRMYNSKNWEFSRYFLRK